MVAASFLVSPLVRSQAELLAVYGSGEMVHTLALRLSCEPDGEQNFKDAIGITLATDPTALPARALSDDTRRELMQAVYPMFGVAPSKVMPPGNASVREHAGKMVLLAHPPCELHFDITPGIRRLAGSFGIIDEGWDGDDRSDGVTFIVVQVSGGNERELLRRHLDPKQRVEDRGVHAFAVEAQAQAGDVFLLRTDGGPKGNVDWDWGFWAGFAIE
jgi:hypothetical protein